MTQEQIKQKSKEYCNAFSVKGEPFERPVTMAYVAGAQSRQEEIDKLEIQNKELRQTLDETLEVALAMKIFLQQYNKPNELLKKYEQ